MEVLRSARWLNLAVAGINRCVATQQLTLAFTAGYALTFGVESIIVLGWGAYQVTHVLLTVGMLMVFMAHKDEFSSRIQRFIDNRMAMQMVR